MVQGVCLRILDDPHEAEDAFQATFLVLVKKAKSLRDRELLSSWLYGVALRIARKARAESVRRRAVEGCLANEKFRPAGDDGQAELRAVIDEEISRLPERYRVPLVLCHMEGMRHLDVAQRLGCPVGTVESRLSRAREQLRSRLSRRGLAPTAAVLAGVLMPSDSFAELTPLVETTTRAMLALTSTTTISRGFWSSHDVRKIVALKSLTYASAGLAATALLITGSSFLARSDASLAAGTPPAVRARVEIQANAGPVKAEEHLKQPPTVLSHTIPPRKQRPGPYAQAVPLEGITIDGRLDDWPQNLKRYPIANRLLDRATYDPEEAAPEDDPHGYFMSGYNRELGLIYLAVVVPDTDLVMGNKDALHTDSVEIYVDGLCSERHMGGSKNDNWPQDLQAIQMPVLQYVGLPGDGPVYANPGGGNPTLMYGKISKTTTQMQFRIADDLMIYEWAVQAFDAYPGRPTRLEPGKSVGLEIAVVDRDSDRDRPRFITWGRPPRGFKGFDARQLGELILEDRP
jgi:RNA polymerase sigma factor (sigma-70 family)